MSLLRRSLLLIAASLLAVGAIRVAAVLAFASDRPALAERFWPGHPDVALANGFLRVAQSVAAGHTPPPATTAPMRVVSARDPLNPGPLLVEGTRAFAAGELVRAERLLVQSSRLDPLGPAPRFLLAELYFRQGRVDPGLAEVGFLLDRLDGNAAPLVPALAQYATQPGAPARLKPLLAEQPVVRDQILALLADNPANLATILALAPPPGAGGSSEWQQRLATALITHQDYARARQVWQHFGQVADAPANRLYNPAFRASGPPPPFNWRLAATPAGTSEPQAGGGLHLLYFGREDVVLADQILTLPPGRYRLGFAVRGEPTGLGWALTCLPGTARQETPLGPGRLDFLVPPSGCKAQQLALTGSMGDYPITADVTVSPLTLVRRDDR